MTSILIAAVCLVASMVGSVVGIGGGVIIKPAIDAMNVMPVSMISFLSGVTVLCMSGFNVAKDGLSSKRSRLNMPIASAISVGAAIGGIVGKVIFSAIIHQFGTENTAGAVQSICLFALTALTLGYTVNKSRIRRFKVRNFGAAAAIGMILGLFSSFLGIGGGPINIMCLSLLFSFGTRECVAYSLFTIMCSQAASLVWQIATASVPDFDARTLVMMALCGVAGGAVGGRIKNKLDVSGIDKVFEGLLVVIMLVCAYNLIKFATT